MRSIEALGVTMRSDGKTLILWVIATGTLATGQTSGELPRLDLPSPAGEVRPISHGDDLAATFLIGGGGDADPDANDAPAGVLATGRSTTTLRERLAGYHDSATKATAWFGDASLDAPVGASEPVRAWSWSSAISAARHTEFWSTRTTVGFDELIRDLGRQMDPVTSTELLHLERMQAAALSDQEAKASNWSFHFDFAKTRGDAQQEQEVGLGAFHKLFPMGTGYQGYEDLVGRENTVDISVGASLQPWQQVTLSANVHLLRHENGGSGAGAMRPGRSGPWPGIGAELDLSMRYHFDRRMMLLLGYGRFFADEFETRTGPGEDVEFIYANVLHIF